MAEYYPGEDADFYESPEEAFEIESFLREKREREFQQYLAEKNERDEKFERDGQ